MKERPIIFSAPMVQAILDGRKTQTRRIVAQQPKPHHWACLPEYRLTAQIIRTSNGPCVLYRHDSGRGATESGEWSRRCPYGDIGDCLWVRETWAHDAQSLDDCRRYVESDGGMPCGPYYKATARTFDIETLKWRPSIHMPRWASRITLEVSDIRVEPLQDISEKDARAEGVLYVPGHGEITLAELRDDPGYSNYLCCRLGFEVLWNEIHGRDAWQANPWVWVISFRRIERQAMAA